MSMDGDQVVQATSSSNKVFWTKEMERKLLDLLQEQVQLGKKADGGFKKEAWTAIERRFNNEMKMNLSKENFKNKLKTWKQGYRLMKELRNTSGLAWNETTQSMDAEDSVWEELLKRKEFKNARMYKRQPFQYFNELSSIVGNDIAEGTAAAIAQEIEKDFVDDDVFNDHGMDNAYFETAADLGNDGNESVDTPVSNQSTASGNDNPSTSSRRPKRRRGTLVNSLDSICETIKDLSASITAGLAQPLRVDKASSLRSEAAELHKALKAIPGLRNSTIN